MNALVWQRRLRRFGLPGLIGIGLLLLALSLWWFLVRPELAALDAISLRSTQLQSRLRAELRNPATPAPSGADSLQQFFGFFPDTRTVPDWLAVIDRDATRDHLKLTQADYRIVRDTSGELTRYQVNLPLRGSYQQIAAFCNHVLRDVPIAAIESMSFERQRADDPQLEARLRLTLFFGREP